MKPSLIAVEAYAEIMEREADAAWLAWVRAAVARGVRCDVSLLDIPLVVDRGNQRTTTTTPRKKP